MIIENENKTQKLMVSNFIKSYLLIFIFDGIFTFIFGLNMTLLAYLGPYASSVFICEDIHKKIRLDAKECVKLKFFWLNVIFWQFTYLTYTIIKGEIAINGVGLVFLIQVMFVFAGTFTARMYQWIRNRKQTR